MIEVRQDSEVPHAGWRFHEKIPGPNSQTACAVTIVYQDRPPLIVVCGNGLTLVTNIEDIRKLADVVHLLGLCYYTFILPRRDIVERPLEVTLRII